MSSEKAKLSPEEEKEIADLAIKRLRIPREFVESVERINAAKTVKEQLDRLDMIQVSLKKLLDLEMRIS